MASLSLGGLTLPVGKSATDGSPLLNRKPLSRQAAGSNLGFKVDVSGGVKNQQAGGSSSSSSSDSGRKGSQGDMLSGEKVLRLVNTYLQQVAVDEDKVPVLSTQLVVSTFYFILVFVERECRVVAR